jgi:MFS family permease
VSEQSPNPDIPQSSIPGTVKGLALVSLFNDFASEMIYPLLPAFVTGVLGGTATSLAALDGAAEFTAALTKWWSGRLADRLHWRKPLILLGYLSAVLVRPLISLSNAAWQVIGFRVVDRIGKGLRTPARDAMISDVTPPELRGRAFGFHRAADHFGSIPGSLLAWWLLSHSVDVRRVLGWSAVPGVVAFVVLWVVLAGPKGLPDGRGQADRRTLKDSLTVAGGQKIDAPVGTDAGGKIFWAPVLTLAALVLFRLPETLLLLRLQQLGVAVATIPLVWAGLHVVRTLSSYPGGWVSDHLAPRDSILAGALLFAATAAILARHLTPAGAVATFLAIGLVAGLTESAERLMVTRLAPKRTGRGFGAYHAVTGLAALPASVLFGLVYQNVDGAAALRLSAAFLTLTALGWVVASRLPALRNQ